ncbi:MAG TPA: hypothetical protein VMV93_12150 [Chloroflexota bacterium]|nr:hypothetical protein [Chloroflexota bacterium]
MMAGAVTVDWRERVVSAWRQQGLATRLRELLDVEVGPETVQLAGDGSTVLLEGVAFTLHAQTRALEATAPCPRCHKAKPATAIETMSDVGRVLDSLCRDCDFLVRSGVAVSGSQPAGAA